MADFSTFRPLELASVQRRIFSGLSLLGKQTGLFLARFGSFGWLAGS
jgi:hypothetical protein